MHEELEEPEQKLAPSHSEVFFHFKAEETSGMIEARSVAGSSICAGCGLHWPAWLPQLST